MSVPSSLCFGNPISHLFFFFRSCCKLDYLTSTLRMYAQLFLADHEDVLAAALLRRDLLSLDNLQTEAT